MNFNNLKVVIMAGGKGERLWPRSTKTIPKQFCPITSDQAMVTDTYDRFLKFVPKKNIYISINKDYQKLLKKHLPALALSNIIFEPEGRDTAASILISLLATPAKGDDVFLFSPADHYIKNITSFKKDITQGFRLTMKEAKMTLFGIPPTYASDGFGYIKTTKFQSHYIVDKFVEKPSVAVAKRYLTTKKYFWNSGMFLFKKQHLLSLFQQHMAEDYKKANRYLNHIKKNKKKYQLNRGFEKITKISFDYAIVEKLKNINCIKTTFDWDDVGNWEALFRIQKRITIKTY